MGISWARVGSFAFWSVGSGERKGFWGGRGGGFRRRGGSRFGG